MSSYTVDYSHCMFVSCFVRWRFIWDRLLWPHSSASYIYGIYYLENRRKQAKIQGNIYNSILYMFEKTQNSPTQSYRMALVYYYKIVISYKISRIFILFSSSRLRIPWTELKLSLYIFCSSPLFYNITLSWSKAEYFFFLFLISFLSYIISVYILYNYMMWCRYRFIFILFYTTSLRLQEILIYVDARV
jgi:hypothetical protein